MFKGKKLLIMLFLRRATEKKLGINSRCTVESHSFCLGQSLSEALSTISREESFNCTIRINSICTDDNRYTKGTNLVQPLRGCVSPSIRKPEEYYFYDESFSFVYEYLWLCCARQSSRDAFVV